MQVAIISDIHDNLVNLAHFLQWSKREKITAIICCGDITNSETLNFLASQFKGTIYLVKGNMEIYQAEEVEKYNNISYNGRAGRFTIERKIIGLCHEPALIKEVLARGRCDLVFYGHTHKPWIEKKKNVTIVNPGTLGSVFQRATFTFWDTEAGKLELKLLDKAQ